MFLIAGWRVTVEIRALKVGILHTFVSVKILLISCSQLALRWTCLGTVFGRSLQCWVQTAALYACRPYGWRHTLVRIVQVKHWATCYILIRRLFLLLFLTILVHIDEPMFCGNTKVWNNREKNYLGKAVFGYRITITPLDAKLWHVV